MWNGVELTQRQTFGFSTHMLKTMHHRFNNEVVLIFLHILMAFASNFNIKFGIIQDLRGIHIA